MSLVCSEFWYRFSVAAAKTEQGFWVASLLLQLQTNKVLVDSREFKSSRLIEPQTFELMTVDEYLIRLKL